MSGPVDITAVIPACHRAHLIGWAIESVLTRTLPAQLGGELRTPRLGWKYDWIQKTLGWTAAKNAQANYNYWKASWLRGWDQALCRRERNQSQ